MNEQLVIEKLKQGETIKDIATELHVGLEKIRLIAKSLNLPTAKIIRKCNAWEGFREEFTEAYNTCKTVKEFNAKMLKHPFFDRIKEESIGKRTTEIRNLFGLPPKMEERSYDSQYDRIKGYMIRNSKFCAKRRGIHFDLKYTDFELPKYCPILGIPLTFKGESEGNDPSHASIDRIDNSKGYIPGNVLVISRLANAMKNEATFDQLEMFCKNVLKVIDYYKIHGTLGGFTDLLELYEPRPLVVEPSQESLPELGC